MEMFILTHKQGKKKQKNAGDVQYKWIYFHCIMKTEIKSTTQGWESKASSLIVIEYDAETFHNSLQTIKLSEEDLNPSHCRILEYNQLVIKHSGMCCYRKTINEQS